MSAKFSSNEAAKAFKLLASLGVRLLIAASTRSASVETPLADAARKVYTGELTTTSALKGDLTGITPSDTSFVKAMELVKVSNARLARYLLRSLELAASDDSEPYFIPNDGEVINLEHILPKRPDKNWDDWSDDDRRDNVSRLGNQALMRASDNSHLKSGAFEEKKSSFAKSPYSLTKLVAEQDAWVPAQVQGRQSELAKLAPKAWPL